LATTNQMFMVCEKSELLFQLAFTPVKPFWIVSTTELGVNERFVTPWAFGSPSAPVIEAMSGVLVTSAPPFGTDMTVSGLASAER